MIKRQLDGHSCSCITLRKFLRVVAVLVSSTTTLRLHPFPTTYAKKYENRKQRDCCARFREQLAMSDVERQLVLGRHFDVAGEHALRKRAAGVILEHVGDAAKL